VGGHCCCFAVGREIDVGFCVDVLRRTTFGALDAIVQRSASVSVNMEHPNCGETQTKRGTSRAANGSLQSLAVCCAIVILSTFVTF
jgi:hypothetical protein